MENKTIYADHGDEYKGELLANFSSNVWFGANHDGLYAYLTDRMPLIRRYPEEYNLALKCELAAHLHLLADQLLLTNGSAEGIYLLAQAYRGRKSLIVGPTFSEYGKACQVNDHQVFYTDAQLLENNLIQHTPDLVWICTPNNPDGFSFELPLLEKLVQQFSNTIFIFDTSFKEYCLEKQPESDFISQHGNVILLYSFTKRYGIPGLRMGYIYSSKSIIRNIHSYCVPWSVNTFAVEAFRYLITNHRDDFNISEWLEEKRKFAESINYIDGFQSLDSSTPFFLVKITKGKSADLKQFLLQKSILIRDASGFFQDGNQYIRLLTLSPEKNRLLLNELQQWKSQ
ncbi:MAG: aminotransferase class [Bacteroidetes bacterium]|jgi:threonine-phosphate decarboxylase|nr:aminotransferase class [Bacteroidota bacterium]